MKRAGKTNKVVMETLGIKNVSQIYTWMRWYANEELHHFNQPVGKQYKGLEQLSEVEQLRLQVELLKKYRSLARQSPKQALQACGRVQENLSSVRHSRLFRCQSLNLLSTVGKQEARKLRRKTKLKRKLSNSVWIISVSMVIVPSPDYSRRVLSSSLIVRKSIVLRKREVSFVVHVLRRRPI